jgi:hypothetical protein
MEPATKRSAPNPCLQPRFLRVRRVNRDGWQGFTSINFLAGFLLAVFARGYLRVRIEVV